MEIRSPMARFLVVMAAFVIVVAGMRAAEPILVPFLLSLFIAIICTPPLIWLKSKGVPNILAMLLIVLMIVVCGGIVAMVAGSSINAFRADLPIYQARLSELTNNLFLQLEGLGLSVDIEQLKAGFNPGAALSLAGNTLASFGNMMTKSFLILLTVTFILAEEMRIADKFRAATNSEKTLNAIKFFTHSVNRYMAIKTLISLFTGFLIFIWLWIIGVDYIVLWGFLAFLLNFVPTLGSIIAAIPAVLFALVQLGIGDALLTAAGFIVVNIVIGSILEPRVMGRGLNLSALVVFLSLVFWGWILGPIGMLLSVPLTMTIKLALESFEDTRWIAQVIGSGESALEDSKIFSFTAPK